MTKEIFFALMTVRILNLKFVADQGVNPNITSFRNNRGNSIYLTLNDNGVHVNVIKASMSCYNVQVGLFDFSEDKIETIAEIVKMKLQILKDNKVK
jgi:hypothetical protein